MRNPEYQFVDTSVDALVSLLVQSYEQITGETVQPASPERVFIQWVASIITHERVLNNYTGNQNIPSRADGENLDALAQLMYLPKRPQAQAAGCMQRFHISEAQLSAILVPMGTRVTSSGGLIWETVEDVYVGIGETYADAQIHCQTVGAAGNGYTPGQLNTLIDIYGYYSATENLITSDGGADAATDEEFYQLMRASMDAYSCAGARGSYEYFAKQVSAEIGDVIANSPTPGVVKLYVLMGDGTLASDKMKEDVLAACNADTVRPLTDQVFVEDAEPVEYNIDFTYYTQTGSGKSAVEIQAAVDAAVQEYVSWQDTKLGRDINPDELRERLYHTGIKRIELREPGFLALRNDERGVPQVGQIGEITVISGGYEDE